ncbi:MAG: PTS sugar transporter subunit IIA [Kiritimatiellales bacterium]
MNHEIMTIEEVAEYLRVSERTVYDWAQKGQLPGGKLGTTWRFKRADIEGWVNRQLGTPAAPASNSPVTGFSKILSADRIVFLNTTAKEEALKTLCGVLATSPLIRNKVELETSIFRREELMSTGIGFGIGVPHVRLSSISDLVMALGIAREPITDYSSLDTIPVQIICMVAAGSSQHTQYIRTLSAISSHLKTEDVRRALIAAPDAATAYRLFAGTEA